MKAGHIADYRPETKSLIQRLLAAGIKITSGNNGGNADGKLSFDPAKLDEFVEHLVAADDAFVFVVDGHRRLWIHLVFGNEPGVLPSNFLISETLDRVTDEHYEEWSEKEQPTVFDQATLDRQQFNDRARKAADQTSAGFDAFRHEGGPFGQ